MRRTAGIASLRGLRGQPSLLCCGRSRSADSARRRAAKLTVIIREGTGVAGHAACVARKAVPATLRVRRGGSEADWRQVRRRRSPDQLDLVPLEPSSVCFSRISDLPTGEGGAVLATRLVEVPTMPREMLAMVSPPLLDRRVKSSGTRRRRRDVVGRSSSRSNLVGNDQQTQECYRQQEPERHSCRALCSFGGRSCEAAVNQSRPT